jgi:uncharacterized protein
VHPPLIGTVVVDIGRSLRESAFMGWVTLWPLLLGFTLSGGVQAFVSRDSMTARLGDHGPRATTRAALYGMASSSCSYAASAMSKSLFAMGADFVASNVFMFASTNLVVEVGLVLVALMGWQFAASEFVGGILMVVLLSLIGGLYFRGRRVAEARDRVEALSAPDMPRESHELSGSESSASWTERLRSPAAWAEASTYTMSDLTMLRRELAFGYVVAGFLTVLVPARAWSALFFSGHGIWTSAENAVVGPLVALASCVCSVGSVPLAAALWHGGSSFGGVIAFLFADLIAFPLLLIYRRYYGTRLMLRMLGLFWSVMSVAGLLTELLFGGAGLVPSTRPAGVVGQHFSWDYTTVLNLCFLVLFGLLYRLYRRRDRFTSGYRTAIDPVCRMQVATVTAPAQSTRGGRTVYFCSDHCRARFEATPERWSEDGASTAPVATRPSSPTLGRCSSDLPTPHSASPM